MTPSYAVLIPSKGRPSKLRDMFVRCPMLNTNTTYVGVDQNERDETLDAYERVHDTVADKVAWLPITNNPDGYTSVAREELRRIASRRKFGRYVLTDDNCRFDELSLRTLLAAQAYLGGVVAGAHPTANHFHADQIVKGHEVYLVGRNCTVYPQVGMIFWCIPGDRYLKFTYPKDCYFDDVYLILWLLSSGFTDFWSCLQAKFDKHLHEAGGTGSVSERIRKRGIGFARLATDFPQWMTTNILSTRVPYTRIIEAVKRGEKAFKEKRG